MSRFRVVLSDEARTNVGTIYNWIAGRSAQGAGRWYGTYRLRLRSSRSPLACPPVDEQADSRFRHQQPFDGLDHFVPQCGRIADMHVADDAFLVHDQQRREPADLVLLRQTLYLHPLTRTKKLCQTQEDKSFSAW